jgi:PilZ domain
MVSFETVKEAEVTITVVKQTQVERRERRKATRYSLFLPVTVQTPRQRSWNARSKNVSVRGAYLFVDPDDNLLPGTELDLTLTLPKEVTTGAEVRVHARGKAVRVDKFAKAGTRRIGLAVAFETCDFVRSASPYC